MSISKKPVLINLSAASSIDAELIDKFDIQYSEGNKEKPPSSVAFMIDALEFANGDSLSILDLARKELKPLLISNNKKDMDLSKYFGAWIKSHHVLAFFYEQQNTIALAPLGSHLEIEKITDSGSAKCTVTLTESYKNEHTKELEKLDSSTKEDVAFPSGLESIADSILRLLQAGAPKLSERDAPPEWVNYRRTLVPQQSSFTLKKQTPFIDIQWEIEQFGVSTGDSNKYIRISPVGLGVDPGDMTWNNKYDRGYFQDFITVEMRPRTYSENEIIPLYIYQTSPNNINEATTVTSSTSFGFSKDGLSFDAGREVESVIQDFSITNASTPTYAQWDFKLATVGGYFTPNDYNKWEDLINVIPVWYSTTVRELPILAKELMAPNCQAVWNVPADCNATISCWLGIKQTLRNTYVENSGGISWLTKYTDNNVSCEVYIDMSKV